MTESYFQPKTILICLLFILTSSLASAADIVFGDTTICPGTSAQLEIEGDFATLQWAPETGLSCDNCPNPRATPISTTTYTATFEENGVEQSLSITVFVPQIRGIQDIDVCRNTEVVLDAGDVFEGFDYFWEPAALFSCTDCPNPTLLNTSATGPINVIYGIRNSECSIQNSFRLTIRDADGPVYSILEDARYCAGDAIELGGPSDAGTVYSWTSNPAGFTSTLSNPTVSPTGDVTYFLEASKPGCPIVAIDSVQAILTTPAIVNFPTDEFDICEGDSIAITSGLVEESDVRYSWMPQLDILDSLSLNTTVFPTATTEYILTAAKGVCEVVDTITVNVTEIALEIIEGDTVFTCLGDMIELGTTARPDPNSVVWSPAGSFNDLGNGNIAVTRRNENYFLFAEITNGMCTIVDSIFHVVDSLPPNREIMPQDTTICEGEFVILRSEVFEPMAYPNLEYEWVPGDGGFQTGDTLFNAVVTPTDTTEYTRFVFSGACRDSNKVTVNVQPVETINVIPADTTVCVGESFQYQITNTGLEDFEWTPGTGLSCTSCPDPMVTANISTMFMVEAVDNMGCPVMGGATLNVEQLPELTFTGSGQICPGETVILNEFAIPGVTYSWTSTDPNFTPTTNPRPTVSPTVDATYTATLNSPICGVFSQDINISIIPPANLAIDAPAEVCPGDEVTLTASSGGVSGVFEWNTAELSSSINVIVNNTTTYTVTFSNQCEIVSEDVTIQTETPVNPGIIPDPPRTNINLGESLNLNLNVNLDPSQIANVMWTENGESIGGNDNTVGVRPPIEGSNEYRVKVTTVNGCEYEGLIIIFAVEPSVVIPNAFTPNGDGLNDELNVVRIIGDVEVNQLSIFDRWGNKVYEESDGGWDGTFNGKPMPSDVYVYVIEIGFPDGSSEVRRGEISLIR